MYINKAACKYACHKREQAGFTQAYVAEQAGVTQAMLCQIERERKTRPSNSEQRLQKF